ncbi:LacI family transcriptional regulator [Halioglobus maricola]|uniref:LacI family transcriptional regulator n=1 Tax=Halioglobus maricola TaxID=2601894 RepID=A0A5P9NPX3_9GAMM|nr:LacI family DNA-binding transcriptional regulator [Halioglobus maricola]QFU77334.1 LacI family transcriptional regulator [Halioglobus maricola]
MANIREVSRIAGVSTATVSRALSTPDKVSKKTLAKVEQAVAQAGYRPNLMARNFRSTRAYALLVLVPDITNLFFAELIQAIEDTAQRAGYSVLLGDTRDSHKREEDYIQLVETRQADGIIQLRPYRPGEQPAQGLNVVSAAGCSDAPCFGARIDNRAAACALVTQLISIGHQRIGIVGGLSDNPHHLERLSGYRQALETAGIEEHANLLQEGDFTLGAGYQAGQYFAALPHEQRPTALFCMNDDMALGAMRALREAGLSIPGDMSIAGFDNCEYARYANPPLTTIAQPAREMGQAAAETLISMIEGNPAPQQDLVLPFELVLRDSVGPPTQPASV